MWLYYLECSCITHNMTTWLYYVLCSCITQVIVLRTCALYYIQRDRITYTQRGGALCSAALRVRVPVHSPHSHQRAGGTEASTMGSHKEYIQSGPHGNGDRRKLNTPKKKKRYWLEVRHLKMHLLWWHSHSRGTLVCFLRSGKQAGVEAWDTAWQNPSHFLSQTDPSLFQTFVSILDDKKKSIQW